MTSHKFMGRVERIFENRPKSLEWQSFIGHDLDLLVDTCIEVQGAAIQHDLNRAQTAALAKDAVYPRPFPAKPGPLIANVRLCPDPGAERGICFSSPIRVPVLTNAPC